MRFKHTRLSVMLFLEYFVLGATMPILSLYFQQNLGFSGVQIGLILAVAGISAFLAPVMAAFVADRLIPAERLLALSHFAGALLMLGLWSQRSFWAVLTLNLLYAMIIMPTVALTNTITFHHNENNRGNFGGLRLWGTIGWFVVAWVFLLIPFERLGIAQTARLSGALLLSAGSSLALALYALTLPVSVVTRKAFHWRNIIPVDSVRIMMTPVLLTATLVSVLVTMADRFYYFASSPYLKSRGFSEASILPVLSLGQIPEIFGMALLGVFLKRFGIRTALLAGIGLEILRFAGMWAQGPVWLIYAAVSLHGLAYTFAFIPISIAIDHACSKTSRAGAHQLFAFLTGGAATMAGNMLAGGLFDALKGNAQSFPQQFWLAPVIISAAALIIGFVVLKDVKSVSQEAN